MRTPRYLLTLSVSLVARLYGATVTVNPGDNIQAAVNANAAGTTYHLNAGVYRQQTITPKTGDTFEGAGSSTVLNGSKLITSWTASSGHWVSSGQLPGGIQIDPETNASCQCAASTFGCTYGVADYSRCKYMNEMFRDGTRLKHVGSSGNLTAGTWYWDGSNILVADDPTGHTMELSITNAAFPNSSATNVTVRNLVIEKYANASQDGAIVMNGGWLLDNVEVRNTHGNGILIYGGTLRNSHTHHNGQLGLSTHGTGITIDGNELDHNNAAGYRYDWEAGSTKFFWTTNSTIKNNYSHDNYGPGLWPDYNNQYLTLESNRVENDMDSGMGHEISFDATYRYNYIRNIRRRDIVPNSANSYKSAIMCGTCRRLTVYGNTIVQDGGCGICGLDNTRAGTSGQTGETFDLTDYNVHDNVVVITQAAPDIGAVAAGIWPQNATDPYAHNAHNTFTNNTYKLYDNDASLYYWNSSSMTRSQWQSAGNDTTGTWISSSDTSFPSSKFEMNDQVKANASLAVRSLPTTSEGSLLATEAANATGTVTKVRGPIRTGGVWWWQVKWADGTVGWSVESGMDRQLEPLHRYRF